jgi:hypothetical protein
MLHLAASALFFVVDTPPGVQEGDDPGRVVVHYPETDA